MIPAQLPPNEKERLDMLRLYKVLDTAPENVFDDITNAAAARFKVPIALVSLVDANRQWFKSCIGLSISETGRDESFCAHAILDSKPFIIPDAQLDIRFRDNPLVTGQPYIRFYAGVPLITEGGYALGTLCLIDRQPRILRPSEIKRLEQMAETVVMRLKLRLSSLGLEQLNTQLTRERVHAS